MAGAFSPGSIGLIGAGLMGTAFAERLLAAGFHVIMWDRDASRMAPLSALGAESAANAVVVGARCAPHDSQPAELGCHSASSS